PMSFTRTWLRCAPSGACEVLADLGTAYALTDADLGFTMRYRVRATNVAGSATSESAPSATVSAAPRTFYLNWSAPVDASWIELRRRRPLSGTYDPTFSPRVEIGACGTPYSVTVDGASRSLRDCRFAVSEADR